MHTELVKQNNFDKSKPIQMIGITNHEGGIDNRRRHSTYAQASSLTKTPLIGYWRSSDTNFKYTDVSYPVQMSTKKAKSIDTSYAQETILQINPNGDVIFV